MKELIYKAVVVIGLLLIIGFGWWYIKKQSDEISRLSDNQQQLISEVNSTLKLTTDEFKIYLQVNNQKLLQRMSDSLKITIRPRNITNYETTNYTYKDTTIIEVPINEYGDVFRYEHKDSCFAFNGYVDVVNNKLIVENRELSDRIIKVDYVKRKPIKWLFGLRLGKREAKVYIESKCGIATSQEIEIN